MRRSRIRARPRPRASDEEVAARDAWWAGLGRSCAVTGRRGGPGDPIEGHHVLRREVLRRYARTHGLEAWELIWDPRNRMPVLRSVHARHTTAKERIPREALPAAAREQARELGLEWVLERDYPA